MTTTKSGTRFTLSDDRALGYLYFISFGGAALGSFFLSLMGFSWLPAIWAVLWMGGYLIIANHRAREEVRTAEFADNFYYFGFLLTLVSLFGVLVQLGFAEETMGDTLLRTVLSQFGLALITTIFGLVVRTVILMRPQTVDDAEARAEARMARAFDDFVHSLNRLTVEADAFSQGFGERLRTIMAGVEGSVAEFGEIVRATGEKVSPLQEEFDGAARAIRTSAEGVTQATEGLSGELRGSADTVRGAFAGFRSSASEALNELIASTAKIRESLEAATSGVRQPLEEVRSHVAAFGRELVDVSGALSRLPTEVRQATAGVGEALDPLAQEVRGLRAAVAEVQESVRGVATVLDAEGKAVATSVGSLETQVARLGEVHARLTEEAEGSSQAVLQVRSELAAGVGYLLDVLQPTGGAPPEGNGS